MRRQVPVEAPTPSTSVSVAMVGILGWNTANPIDMVIRLSFVVDCRFILGYKADLHDRLAASAGVHERPANSK